VVARLHKGLLKQNRRQEPLAAVFCVRGLLSPAPAGTTSVIYERSDRWSGQSAAAFRPVTGEVMKKAPPQPTRLRDYQPPAWLIDTVELWFDLDDQATVVRSRLALRRNPAAADGAAPLVLDGERLELLAVVLDGQTLAAGQDYRVSESQLTLIRPLPERCQLEITTRIKPQENLALEGLYRSGATYCSQCEAEGFRKITYYLDRPDVMAVFTTEIEADERRFPVLLSNGNRVAAGRRQDPQRGARHWVRWHDPFPKPCYLFALVGGTLELVEDRFVTRSGRPVTLQIYVEPGQRDKCGHAMASLKKAMAWDEQVYGLEYDLDLFMIVAVHDFNMGAMENKGLNVFNSKYVLARPETATDQDFLAIESVIAHEYFHNWSGNRVTCRDWFQLSLKEGLTVFRDQEFSADHNSRAVRRIQDVQRLRAAQFAEDAGALAHPVRPESYLEINNFYTPTVYEKGAEVIRMIRTLLGAEGYRRGIDLYFARHDGQAVTCDDFVAAMAEANQVDLSQFKRWYAQAGTPELALTGEHDPVNRTWRLTVSQTTPPTPGQPEKLPLHLPLALALLDPVSGAELPLRLEGEPQGPADGANRPTTRVLEVREAQQSFVFADVPHPPVASLLRGFSAPVRLVSPRPTADLTFLMAHDRDGFNRWEAGQMLATRLALALVEDWRAGRPLVLEQAFIDAVGRQLAHAGEDPAFAALALTLPGEAQLGQQMAEVDVDGLHAVREFMRRTLAEQLHQGWLACWQECRRQRSFVLDGPSIGRRALANVALAYLSLREDDQSVGWCLEQYHQAATMTESLGALSCLAHGTRPERDPALADFYQRWRGDPLVVNKWLSLQAMSPHAAALAEVRRLMDHESFDRHNPNKLYALIGAFCSANQVRFHAADGSGYRFLADQVLALDSVNAQVAARLAGPFTRWRRFDPARRQLMAAELQRLLDTPGLSPDVYEIISKSLAES